MDNTLWADVNSISSEVRKPEQIPDKRSALDKDAFLKLLLTELKYQDPLNPTDDKAFIAQMAQFSTLEQMQNMSKVLSLSQSCSMIGHTISAQTKDKEISGTAEAVVIRNGVPYIKVDGDEAPLDSVIEIRSAE